MELESDLQMTEVIQEEGWAKQYKDIDQMQEEDEIIRGIELKNRNQQDLEITDKISFYIKELGGVRTIQGKQIYIVTESAEISLKRIKIISFGKLFIREMECVLGQLIAYHVYLKRKQEYSLSKPLIKFQIEEFLNKKDYLQNYEEYQMLLSDNKFIDFLIQELTICVKVKETERTKFENDIIEMILYIIRNSLCFDQSIQKNQTIFFNLIETYMKPNGIFDVVIFLSQDFTDKNKKLSKILLEISDKLTHYIQPNQIVYNKSDQQFKRNLEKLKMQRQQQNRRMQLSTRHSKFGALFQVKKYGETIGLVSNPMKIKNLEELISNKNIKNKIQKPKTRSKIPGKNTEFSTQLKLKFSFKLKQKLNVKLIDLLSHSYDSLIETNYNLFYSQEEKIDFTQVQHFIDFVSFGIEYGLLQKKNWILSGVQIFIIDFIFNKWNNIFDLNKSEIDYLFLESCINYFVQTIKAIRFISQQNSSTSRENSDILKKTIFSKDFSKIVKKSFKLLEKVPKNPINQKLIICIDLFFQLLTDFDNKQVFSVKNRIMVDVIPENEEEDIEQIKNKYKYKEKQFTYLTELGIFLEYNIINIHVEFMKNDNFIMKPEILKQAIYNFIHRIINDLDAKWMFYQIDYLKILHSFFNERDTLFLKDPIVQKMKILILEVFKGIRQVQSINQLAVVEMLFRFNNFTVKEELISNYTGIKQIYQEERVEIILPEEVKNDNFLQDAQNKSQSNDNDIVKEVLINDYQDLIFDDNQKQNKRNRIFKRLKKKKDKLISEKPMLKKKFNSKQKIIMELGDENLMEYLKNRKVSEESCSLEFIEKETQNIQFNL